MAEAILRYQPGFQLVTGDSLNTLVDAVNNLQGNGRPGAITGSTGAFSGFVAQTDIATGLSGAGTARGNATAITHQTNFFATVLIANTTGAVLPTLTAGQEVTIYNDGAGTLTVYAPGSVTIDGVAGATGVPLSSTKRCRYFAKTASALISNQLGVVSA